jgi:hypothetical protein
MWNTLQFILSIGKLLKIAVVLMIGTSFKFPLTSAKYSSTKKFRISEEICKSALRHQWVGV